MGIISWIVFGLIAGFIAKLINKGPEPGGIIGTIVVGVLGGLVGGYIGSLLFDTGVDDFGIGSFLLAILGALLVLAVYKLIVGRRHTPDAGARRARR